MALKLEIIDNALVMTDTVTSKVIFEEPAATVYVDTVYFLNSPTNLVKFYRTYIADKQVGEEGGYLLSDLVDSTLAAFTPISFLIFVRKSLGFKSATGGSVALIKAFKARTLADSGIFENEDALKVFTKDNYSLIKNASLVLTPNGYKNSKLFAMVPSDGSGDMTWTRASEKTRVNESELVETLPHNLLQYSEEFDNAIWQKSNVSIIANTIISPSGLQDADTLTNSLSTGFLSQLSLVTIGGNYTFSLYVKNNNAVSSSCLGRSSLNNYSFILNWLGSTLTSITNLTGVTTFVSLSDNWYKVSCVFSALESSFLNRIYSDNNLTSKSIYIWGAQLNAGATAKPYLKTTDRLNIPSIDYSSGTGAILVEPQATNLVTYSRDFENAAWSKTDLTVSGKKLIPTAVSGGHLIRKNSTTTTAGKQTMSVIAKADGYNFIRFWEDASTGKQCYFDLINGTATNVNMESISIIPLGNGYYKCSATLTVGASSSFGFRINVTPDGSITPFVGDGIKGVLIDYAQLETGSVATSSIPTTTATVTRVADAVSKTGISSLIGQTEGVLFVEMAALVDDSTYRTISLNSSASNFVLIRYRNSSNSLQAFVFDGATAYLQTISGVSILNYNKFALRYSNSEISFWLNGVKQLAGISGDGNISSLSLNKLEFGNSGENFYGKIKQLQIFKTALSDAEMITLTT
jgi:hypothetical protein